MITLSLNSYSIKVFCAFILITVYSCNTEKKDNSDSSKKNSKINNFKPQLLKDTIGGVYHEYYKNGNVKVKGVFKNGKRDGDWSFFYENGKLWSLGEYNEGIRNGGSSVYYANGVLRMEGHYLNDKQIGLWKFYNEQGKLIKEVQM